MAGDGGAIAPVVPNGLVGDWRLDDAAFLSSFTLPGSEQKLNTLEARNPLPRDDRIAFDETEHKYLIDSRFVAPSSVTQLVHYFCAPFDSEVAIASMRKGRNWTRKRKEYLRADGQEMTNEEIAASWALNGKVQSARGTLMHFHIEQYLNGAVIEEPHSIEFSMFLRFQEDFMKARGLVPLRTELSLFHCGLSVAGQADLLAVEQGTGHIYILDWKRSKAIAYVNRFQKLSEPLAHLDDCNYVHYCLQLNIYRHILETEYDMHVGGMYLGVFHPSQSGPICVEVPRLEEQIALIVQNEKALRPTQVGPPLPGPNAPFGAPVEVQH
jgi:ATP-dependent exoDNAse (exonuclease V) beta subunit